MSALLLPFLIGLAAGAVSWPLLWLTVRRLPQTRHPGFLIAFSSVVRIALVLLALYAAMDGEALRLLVSVAGFLLVRFVLTVAIGLGESRSGATS